MNPLPMDYLVIDGDLFIEDTQDFNITVNNMWIKSGTVHAGSKNKPFTHNLVFQINGERRD
jgi:hypothetical protein